MAMAQRGGKTSHANIQVRATDLRRHKTRGVASQMSWLRDVDSQLSLAQAHRLRGMHYQTTVSMLRRNLHLPPYHQLIR